MKEERRPVLLFLIADSALVPRETWRIPSPPLPPPLGETGAGVFLPRTEGGLGSPRGGCGTSLRLINVVRGEGWALEVVEMHSEVRAAGVLVRSDRTVLSERSWSRRCGYRQGCTAGAPSSQNALVQ